MTLPLYDATLAAWLDETFNRVMRVQEKFHDELAQSQARTADALAQIPYPNPINQSDEE